MQVSCKSQVDFYVSLCVQLIGDDPLGIAKSKDLQRDIEVVKSRCSNEGLSFLTKSLPQLGKALDQAFENSRFSTPIGFPTKKGRSTPAFLQAYFNLVFDEDGLLRKDACEDAVRHLRQVFFLAYKLENPYSNEEKEMVISNFTQTDKDLELLDDESSHNLIDYASHIISILFAGFDPREVVPRHGPGAVATGEKLDAKWLFRRKYQAIHQVYPYYEYFMVGGSRELTDRLAWYNGLEDHISGTAKVVLVPKDSRGPRLISCEPLEYQWLQQGLGRKLVSHLESHWLSRGQINFTHQRINQELATSNSVTRRYATLDLKDASDRVSLRLVRGVFRRTPELALRLEALRSTATRLPNGDVITLNKYAPMGSALCFPVEATVFWAIMVAAVRLSLDVPFERAARRIYVYGDDIVVPSSWSNVCMEALESVGLIVNRNKSYIKGPFRESCGVDAFNGINVTPLRLKKPWTGRPSDGTAYASYTSLANRLLARGYKSASSFLWKELEHVYGKIPYGVSTSPFPCHEVSSALLANVLNKDKGFKYRWNAHYHRLEFRVRRLSNRRRRTRLDDWARLLRDLVSPPFEDPSRVVLPLSTRIKSGWASV